MSPDSYPVPFGRSEVAAHPATEIQSREHQRTTGALQAKRSFRKSAEKLGLKFMCFHRTQFEAQKHHGPKTSSQKKVDVGSLTVLLSWDSGKGLLSSQSEHFREGKLSLG